jgi:outer membrane immunogenic protein
VCGTSIGGVCVGTSPLNGAAVTNLQAKILWFGTVRGRVGWLATDQILLYATGGLAYGQVSVSGDLNTSASAPSLGLKWGPGTNAFSASNTNVGFAVGGGLEGKFTGWLPPNWSWKLEYLYLDLGSLDTSTLFVAQYNAGNYSDTTGTMTTHTRFTDHIVRVGLNFQFNPETISRTR